MKVYGWYAVAAAAEIFGCYAFWLHLRAERSPAWLAAGVASLILFGFSLTRVDTQFAGRSYAAYGGIYIAAALLWLVIVEHARPTLRDIVGDTVSIIRAAIILSARSR